MSYLLDTNICIYWLKGNQVIEQQAIKNGLENLFISFITLSELYYGAFRSKRVLENLASIYFLKNKLKVIESNEKICETFGKIKANLVNSGKIIDDADIFIASCALNINATLVTNNEKHFVEIEDLKIVNWIKNIS